MNNFYYYNPTKIIFGKGMLQNIKREIPQKSKVLIIYGMGSIKKNGLYDELIEVLKDYEYFEYSGIKPNPEYLECLKVVEYIKENEIDYLLAVGGGSVIDATKFIALVANSDILEPWDFMIGKEKSPTSALPYGCIQTLPATGSEMNNAFVINNKNRNEKIVSSSFFTYPKFSVLNPSYLSTLPKEQLINAIIDSYVHILEQYVTSFSINILQSYQCEAFLKTILELSKDILDNKNEENLSMLMWSSAQISSGLLNRGVPCDWATHEIGHQITVRTGLDHAKTLAIILFGVWEYEIDKREKKLSLYGKNIFNLVGNKREIAENAIKKTENFFNSLGMKTRFHEHQVDISLIAKDIGDYFTNNNILIGDDKSIDGDKIAQILLSRS